MKGDSTKLVLLILSFLIILSSAVFSSKISVVISKNITPYNKCYEGFKSEIKDELTVYYLDSNKDVISEIKSENPRVILTIGSLAYHEVINEIHDIPVVFVMVLNPQNKTTHENVTGITMNIDINVRLEYVKRILPDAKNIGILLTPESKETYSKEIKDARKENGYRFLEVTCSRENELNKHLAEFEGQVDCLLLFPDPLLLKKNNFRILMMFSFKNSIPLIGVSPKFVKMGALYGLYLDYTHTGRQASTLVKKVIAGTDPKAIPIEDIKKPTLILNRKIAKKMKVNFNQDIINSALQIYE